MQRTPPEMPRDEAETVALQALGFLASEPSRLTRFVGETGISLDTLHARASEPDVMRAVLESLLRDEPELLMFTANTGLEPEAVSRAHRTIDAAGKPGQEGW